VALLHMLDLATGVEPLGNCMGWVSEAQTRSFHAVTTAPPLRPGLSNWAPPLAGSRPERVQNHAMTTANSWTPLIVAHTAAATSALVLGAVLLTRRKGSRVHRVLGWLWVVLMAFVALVSFGIQREGLSWIHALSVLTLCMLVLAVRLARRHQTERHGKSMKGIYIGALLVTGLFTLLPQRLIGNALWA